MTMSAASARELARHVVTLTEADSAEVLVVADSSALTRFANNRINQNVAEENAQVSIRAVLGQRIGVASTNRLDDDSLRASAQAAVHAASIAPQDPAFPGLPGPAPVSDIARAVAATVGFDAEARAEAVSAIVSGASISRIPARAARV